MSLAVAAMLARGDSTLARSDAAAVSTRPSGTTLPDCAADLGELHPYPTADGSFSLQSDRFGEAFHNSAGARNEAEAKFAVPAQLERFQDGTPLRVLDVCVGLGYNSAAVLEAADPIS